MADIDLFDNWFRVADKDRDGVVSGMEAVEFFQRSQLPQATLFKVNCLRGYPTLDGQDCDGLLSKLVSAHAKYKRADDQNHNTLCPMHTGLEPGGRRKPVNQ